MNRFCFLLASLFPLLSIADEATPAGFLKCWKALESIEGVALNNHMLNGMVTRHGKKGEKMGLWIYTENMAYFVEHPAGARYTTADDAPVGNVEGTTFVITEIPAARGRKREKYILKLHQIKGMPGFPQNPQIAVYRKRDMPPKSKAFENFVPAAESLEPGSLDVLIEGLKNEIEMIHSKVESGIRYTPLSAFNPPGISLSGGKDAETPEKRAYLTQQAVGVLRSCQESTGSALSATLQAEIDRFKPDSSSDKKSH
jgi:hypothetical protein